MSEVRWLIKLRPTSVPGEVLWFSSSAPLASSFRPMWNEMFLTRREALVALSNSNWVETGRLVKITRKPRLSPEAKAARDALCAAAVSRANAVPYSDNERAFSEAGYAYAKAVPQ